MLPSRGLQPRQLASLHCPRSLVVRHGSSRNLSSVSRRVNPSVRSHRGSSPQTANWRAGASVPPNVLFNASSVRYGSWYAPWSWGRSNTPSDASPTPASSSEPAIETVSTPQPVTTSTPELAPAGIDKPAVVESTEVYAEPKSMEELLSADPAAMNNLPIVDPSAPISYWGNMKDLGLDYGWGPSAFFESIMELTYINTGFAWGGTILTSAVLLRLLLFFGVQIRGSDAQAKMVAMNPVLQPLMASMEAAKRAGDDEKVNTLRLQQQAVMKEMGGSLGKTLGVPIAQGIFGYGAFRSLRGMATLPVPGMNTDGFLWFSDLTVSDPFFVLPLATGGLMYFIIKTGGETGVSNRAQVSSYQQYVQIIMPIVATLVTSFQPAALQLYFMTSAVLGGATGWLLRQRSFRSWMGIRLLPSKESEELYTRVVKGEVKLSSIRGADGKIRYQAPNATGPAKPPAFSSKAILPSGIKLKAGAATPAHIRSSAEAKKNKEMGYDVDYEDGIPAGWNLARKWDWLKRNQHPRYWFKRLGNAMNTDKRDAIVKAEQDRRDKAKAAAEKYERERKRRFETGR